MKSPSLKELCLSYQEECIEKKRENMPVTGDSKTLCEIRKRLDVGGESLEEILVAAVQKGAISKSEFDDLEMMVKIVNTTIKAIDRLL